MQLARDERPHSHRQVQANPALCQLLEAAVKVTASPFCHEQIRSAAESLRAELQVAALMAQLRASQLASVELFCLVAQHAPETLPCPWSDVYDMIASEERFWVWPRATVGAIEDGEVFAPYLNRTALATEWRELLDHVQKVVAAQKSGAQRQLTA